MSPKDTIFALSSGSGRAGIAVIRVSGPAAGDALASLAGPLPRPRLAELRGLRSAAGELIDSGIVLWFPGPASFTGEDVAELHVHGGRAVVAAVLASLGAFAGLRTADAGEFARRAFENEKIGLTEVEGLADLIDAETEAQRRQAVRQASGALEALYESWRGRLLEALGLLEASIDFSDEGDVAHDAVKLAEQRAAGLLVDIERHLADGRRGEIVRDGLQVVLAGPPNAGKSSMLNRLARREAAIVSPEAGTTRDVITVVLDLAGFRVVVNDTAGIRPAGGAVEQEGVRRALALGARSDLILWLVDATDPVAVVPETLSLSGVPVIKVWNKTDVAVACRRGEEDLELSALTGEGFAALERVITEFADSRAGLSEEPALTQQRHREALEGGSVALRKFLSDAGSDIELRAEELRGACRVIGRLVGRIDAEDVLGEVFARFCIGK